jgi:predicted Rdx family selenoprotein
MNLNARRFGQRLPIFLVLSGVLVVGSAIGQDTVRATAKQRRSMAPLVESVALCLELHIPSVRASDVVVRVRKALADQRTSMAKANLEILIRDLVMKDRDLDRQDRERVMRDICVKFGQSLPALARELVPIKPTEKSKQDVGLLLVRFAEEHTACLRHKKDGIAKIEASNGEPLGSTTKQGLAALASYYSNILSRAFGIERPSREFTELLTEAMTTSSTRRALLVIVGKLRFLLRPGIYRELEAKTLAEKLDAEIVVEKRIRDVLTDSALWERLRLDHEGMVEDPKAMRRALRDRKQP